MYQLTRPSYVIPMHGEARHLEAQAALAEANGIHALRDVRDGRLVHLGPHEPHIVDRDIPVGRLYRDGNVILPAGDAAVSERRKLAWNGHIAVSVVLSRNGEMAAEPDTELVGLPGEDARGNDMSDRVISAVYNAVDSIPRGRRKDPELVRDAVTRSIRAEMKLAWGKRPLCSVLVSMV